MSSERWTAWYSQAQLVKELLSFDSWISRHFVAIFGNIIISTFQDAIAPKAIELFQEIFHICFYHVTLFQNCFIVLYNLKFKFCCQFCDVIFSPKTVKIGKQKRYDFLEYKVLPSCKVWAQTNKKCKSSSKDALLGVLYAHREKWATRGSTFRKGLVSFLCVLPAQAT